MKQGNRAGFTLIELLITLTILIILSSLTITGFITLFQKSKYDIESSRLIHAVHRARSEAILHGHHVVLCKSKDQKACSGNWQDGYVLLSDNKVIYSYMAHKNNDILNWRAFPYFLNDLEFLSDGSADFQNGTFWYCPERAKNPAWAVMISQSGRARLVLPDAAGKILDEKEKAIVCDAKLYIR